MSHTKSTSYRSHAERGIQLRMREAEEGLRSNPRSKKYRIILAQAQTAYDLLHTPVGSDLINIEGLFDDYVEVSKGA